MDVTNLISIYGFWAGIIVTVLSGVFTLFNKQNLEAKISLYREGNDELRQQIADVKQARDETEKELTGYKAKYEEQSKMVVKLEELISRQADFASLSKQLASNHKQQMAGITDLAKIIAEKR